MQRQGVETRRFTEPEDLLGAVPGVFFQLLPLGNGPFEVSLTTIRLGDVTLHVGHTSACMGFAKTAPDAAVLQLPLENVDSLVVNGVTCRPGIVGTYGSGAEMLRTNPRSSAHAAIILPFGLVETLVEPPAASQLCRPGGHALLQASPPSWGRAERLLRAVGEAAATIPQIFDAEQPRRALREALLHAAHDLVAGEQEAEIRMPRSSKARRHIVVAADAYLHAHKGRPIYTEELCDALGVSASSLAEAFRAIFCISPHRFLKLRRLNMVRAALRSREGAAPLVKSVALSHGFWHLGQFAHDYRATFGESPSETLGRNGGCVAPDDAPCFE
jgi:AraC family ethanolamine operon transcriptional activator